MNKYLGVLMNMNWMYDYIYKIFITTTAGKKQPHQQHTKCDPSESSKMER